MKKTLPLIPEKQHRRRCRGHIWVDKRAGFESIHYHGVNGVYICPLDVKVCWRCYRIKNA